MHHLSIVKTIISLVLQYNAVMLQTIKIIDAYILIFQTMTKNLMCQALMIWFPRMKQIRITRNIWRGKNYRPEEFRDLISPIRNNWLNLLGIFLNYKIITLDIAFLKYFIAVSFLLFKRVSYFICFWKSLLTSLYSFTIHT